MTTPVAVRQAAEADAPLLLSLIQQSFEEYRPLLDPPSGAHRETVNTVRRKVTEGGGFTAYLGDAAAGCVLYEPRDGALYLGRLAVLPAFRKQGVGRLLIEAVENRARDLHCPKVTLAVRVQLPGNRVYFERLGYRFANYNYHQGYSEPTYMTLEKTL